MDIVSRLIKFKDFTGLTNSQFADKAGIPRPTLSQFLNGRNKRLSDDLASKIHTSFPNLNMMWLMFGEGQMVIDSNIEISAGKIEHNSSENEALRQDNQVLTRHAMPVLDNLFEEPIQKKENTNLPLETNSRKVKEEFKEEREESHVATVRPNPLKVVKHIMVFYTDNSYEEFRPVGNVRRSDDN